MSVTTKDLPEILTIIQQYKEKWFKYVIIDDDDNYRNRDRYLKKGWGHAGIVMTKVREHFPDCLILAKKKERHLKAVPSIQ
jgi:hypothetical protein